MGLRAWIRDFVMAVSWLTIVVLLSSLIVWLRDGSLTWKSFIAWDADYFYRIANEGYGISQSAFFPLYPWLWRLFGGEIWMGITLNICLYGITFAIINQLFPLDNFQKLLFLSIPSGFFYGMPYSESVFALGCAGLLYAFKQKNTFLVIILYGVVTLARPAFTILLPALFILLYFDEEISKREKWIMAFGCLISSLVCLYIVNAYQYSFTGVWGGFYKIQGIKWDNRLGIPHLPIRTWGDRAILRLDLLALWLGCISTFMLFQLLILKKSFINIPQSQLRMLIFSLLYVAGICAFVLLMRDGSLFSLNRFVFTTALGGLIWAMLPVFNIPKKVIFSVGLVLIGLSGYVHIQTFLGLLWLLLPLLLIAFIEKSWAKYALILLSFGYQVFLCDRFLQFIWVA